MAKTCRNGGCDYPEGPCDFEEMNEGAFDLLDFISPGPRYEANCLVIQADDE